MIVENAIEIHHWNFADSLSNEYEDLYGAISNEKLRILFSAVHAMLINMFDSMN